MRIALKPQNTLPSVIRFGKTNRVLRRSRRRRSRTRSLPFRSFTQRKYLQALDPSRTERLRAAKLGFPQGPRTWPRAHAPRTIARMRTRSLLIFSALAVAACGGSNKETLEKKVRGL